MELSLVLIIVFTLSCFIGYFVIWGVTPALHTPLMAVTNAISGIVIIGAMAIAGGDELTLFLKNSFAQPLSLQQTQQALDNVFYAKVLAAFGVFLAAINVFGGFAVTARMLAMFRKKQVAPKPGKES